MTLQQEVSIMRNVKAILMGSAALACFGIASGTAEAGSVAYGAGATFPQIAYRQLFDCLYNQAQGSTGKPGPLAKATSCVQFNGSGFGGEILYAPTGSGNGKLVLRTNDKTQIGTPSNSVPYTDSTIGVNSTADYDGIQFAGSDDIINSADMAAWSSAGNFASFGNLVQIPALIGPVALGFNGTDGTGAALNILPATPTGGSSGLNLSRNAVCGIVSGHITQWNNSILTALNGGALGTGNITFVHRQDGSGTTFLLTNALATQCQFEIGPNSESDATTVSYAFPWTDHAGACPRPVAHGANQNNWPDQFPTDQCGSAVANPGGGHFANASGSGSLVALVGSTNGAIGYASADFWLPVKVGGLKTANVQSQWDITASTGQFQPPTSQGAQTAMASAVPQFDNTSRINPLAWSLQGVVPNPVVPGAYPIAGFTWVEMYQCYAVHANGNNGFIWFRTWLDYLYGSDNAHQILRDNGFAEVPGSWTNEIYALLTDPVNGPAQHGNGGCTTIAGAN
jgi:phosphate transport system substrate-binding protein